jgi:predicted TIM-barrel fold metal-dependent hydrolase
VIVDAHTHIFPPEIAANREAYLTADATFAELYTSPKAKLATAADLLASMDAGGIDVSIALGFAWPDPETVRLHNDYLLEAAAVSGGRILPFCSLPLGSGIDHVEAEEALQRQAPLASGATARQPGSTRRRRRPARRQGSLARTALPSSLPTPYPGRRLDLAALYAFVRDHPEVRVIGAHWGGGLPFYALMPEVRLALHNTSVDTAGTSLLYEPDVYTHVAALIGAERILFGSDYPLLSQSRSRARIEAAVDARTASLILGANAQRLLRLE